MQANETPKTVVGEDVEISGSIKCATSVQFDGKLTGDMTCAGNAIIGASASVKGNISVESTTVLGQITGNISARDKVELKSTARVNGDIKAKRMTVEDGVTFVGKSEVAPSGGKPAAVGEPRTEPEPAADRQADARKEDSRSGGFFGRR